MKLIAGIDGGGTKTTLLWKYVDDEIINQKQFGPFNLNSIGEKAFSALMNEIASYLQQQGECIALCIGAAGISNPLMKQIISSSLENNQIHNWKLVGDHEIALEGAFNGKEGMILIAGTGSICFGKKSDGSIERSGGWGHILGDEGSGYGLGRDALSAVARMLDGYGKETCLFSYISDFFGLKDRASIISYVYSNDKSAVASISPLVEKAAKMGDEVALSIISENARKLSLIVKSVGYKLGGGSLEISFHGGLIANDTMLRSSLIAYLSDISPNIHVISPKNDAAHGALSIASGMVVNV